MLLIRHIVTLGFFSHTYVGSVFNPGTLNSMETFVKIIEKDLHRARVFCFFEMIYCQVILKAIAENDPWL